VTDSPALASVSECSTLLMKVNVYIYIACKQWVVKAALKEGGLQFTL